MFKIVIKAEGLSKLPAKLKRFRAGIIERVPVMLLLIGQEIAAIAKNDYLSGPRPGKLGVKSGQLRVSVGPGREGNIFRISNNTLQFGTNLKYAAAHEYGFKGTVSVPGHSRGGHPVRSHSRKVNLPARPFLRPALKDAIPGARSIIQRLANEALREALA